MIKIIHFILDIKGSVCKKTCFFILFQKFVKSPKTSAILCIGSHFDPILEMAVTFEGSV
jgi:hypothetical protein